MKKHDEKIFSFCKQFKSVDEDEDGVIDVYQLQCLMKNVNPNIDVEKLVELVDPSKKGVITFSYLCETLVKHPDFKEYFKGGSAD